MSELNRVPYVALKTGGKPLAARIAGAELDAALKEPRARGWVDIEDSAGELSLADGDDIQVLGGRRGGSETALLTGTVAGDPKEEPGPRRIKRVTVADGWAASDHISLTEMLTTARPQDILRRVLEAAGIASYTLSARVFPGRRLVSLEQWTLAKAVKEIGTMWGISGNAEDEWDRKLGLALAKPLDWTTGFDAAGKFIWDEWAQTPWAKATPLAYSENELVGWERQDDNKGSKGRIELFFDPAAVPGLRLTLPDGVQVRVESRRHRYDGHQFRTEVMYGPVPG